MTTLRIINVLLWGALFAYMIPGAWSASFGKSPRWGDPMRLGVQVTAFIMAAFSLRWLLAPESQEMWAALYILSAANACYIAWLARSYGRGPRL